MYNFNVLWNGSLKPFEIDVTWTKLILQTSGGARMKTGWMTGGWKHSVGRAPKPNHTVEWGLELTWKGLSQSTFLNAISFYYFLRGRAWLVTEGEKMRWKTKPWKQHDGYFLFPKPFFLNFLWKIHEIYKLFLYSFSGVVKEKRQVNVKKEKVRSRRYKSRDFRLGLLVVLTNHWILMLHITF